MPLTPRTRLHWVRSNRIPVDFALFIEAIRLGNFVVKDVTRFDAIRQGGINEASCICRSSGTGSCWAKVREIGWEFALDSRISKRCHIQPPERPDRRRLICRHFHAHQIGDGNCSNNQNYRYDCDSDVSKDKSSQGYSGPGFPAAAAANIRSRNMPEYDGSYSGREYEKQNSAD